MNSNIVLFITCSFQDYVRTKVFLLATEFTEKTEENINYYLDRMNRM